MMRLVKILAVLLSILMLGLVGCAKQSEQVNMEKPQDETVLAGFNQLIGVNAAENDILDFIDANIGKVSKEGAGWLVTGYEARQKSSLALLDEQFTEGKEEKWSVIIPNGLQEFGYIFSMDKIDEVEDAELKKMLEEVRDTGYKVRTAEGMYFPVIDYQFYEKYYPYLADELKGYYGLMAVESGAPPAVDAALQITPDELLNRIVAQETYINQYPGSQKRQDVETLYLRYVGFYLFGINNTPAFAYDTKVLRSDFKQSYDNFKAVGDSKFGAAFSPYLEVLKNENYVLTDNVTSEQQKVIEKVKQALK